MSCTLCLLSLSWLGPWSEAKLPPSPGFWQHHAALVLALQVEEPPRQVEDPPRPPQGFPGQQGQPGGGFPGQPGMGGPPPMGHGQPVMAVTERFVYVLQNGTLYQFDARTLKLMNQTRLPEEEGMGRGGPGRPGRPGGENPGRGGPGGNRPGRPGNNDNPPPPPQQ